MSANEFSTVGAAVVGASSGSFEMAPIQHSPAQRTHPLPHSPTFTTGLHQQQNQPHQQHQQHQQRSVKRPRPVKSCTECRKRKLRCDRLCPCSQCQKSNRTCKYAADYDSANLSDVSDAEVEPGRPTKKPYGSSAGQPLNNSADAGQFSNRRSADRPSSLGMGFVEELAARMDRLEKQFMSRRPSDLKSASSALILTSSPSLRGLSVKRGGQRTRLFGQSSTRVLVKLCDDAKDFLDAWQHTSDIDETLMHFRKLHQTIHKEHRDSLVPMTVFVDSVMPIGKRMMDILPQKPVCDRLVAAYADISEGMCRILHMPTFREQYKLFWERKPQADYFLPQLLAVLAIVSRFTTMSQGFNHERIDGVHTPTAFALVRTWLDSQRGKQLTDISVLQVELLLMVCRKALMFRPQEIWAELGRVVRMAMAIGLHRDPSEFGPRISPFMGEMRRRLWFSVCEMDVQHALDSDMPCAIRDGDYSCQAPRNVDDEELHPDMKELPPGKAVEEHTKVQAQILGTFSLPIRSRISQLVCRIDTVRDYQEVLELGGKLEDILEDTNQIVPRYDIADHSRKSRVWRERVSSDCHVRGALLALYRPFVLHSPSCPSQITKSFLRSCMIVLGYSEEMDPMQPHHSEVMALFHRTFMTDLLAAAFSICYFIQAPHTPLVNGYGSQQGLGRVPDSPNRSPALLAAAGRLMWSPERLTQAVERTLGYFIQNIARNTATKDILSLTVVLEMVRTPEPKSENIARVLRATLEACLKAAKLSREKLAMVKLAKAPGSGLGFAADPFNGGPAAGPFGYGESGMNHRAALTTTEEGWTIWGGWD